MLQKIHKLIFPAPMQNPEEIKRKYNIPNELQLKIQLKPDGWFVATSPTMPGFITQARNSQELLDMINDAVLTYYDVPENEASMVFDRLTLDGYGIVRYHRQPQTA